MSHIPYGYKVKNGVAEIDEIKAYKIQELYKGYLECGSMRAAAMKVGIEKTHSVIGRFLKNKTYLGTEFYPQIIDEDTFKKVQELRNKNAIHQNRIRDFKPLEKKKLGNFVIGNIEEKYGDPFKQAEYAYSQIKEVFNE